MMRRIMDFLSNVSDSIVEPNCKIFSHRKNGLLKSKAFVHIVQCKVSVYLRVWLNKWFRSFFPSYHVKMCVSLSRSPDEISFKITWWDIFDIFEDHLSDIMQSMFGHCRLPVVNMLPFFSKTTCLLLGKCSISRIMNTSIWNISLKHCSDVVPVFQ